MSTRSGKRIHNRSDEDAEAKAELILKSEKKSRSKRTVESHGQEIVLKSKRRRNYVSYPASDEGVLENTLEQETHVKPRVLLNTLREQNVVAEESEPAHVKKQVRQTRRTKKFSETASEECLETTKEVEVVTITKSKPKSKKCRKKNTKIIEQVDVLDKENSAKKSNKKKKNSHSNTVQIKETSGLKNHNNSYVSTDSFHSAAGSPMGIQHSKSPEDMESGILMIDGTTHPGKNKRKSNLRNNDLNDLNSSTTIKDAHVVKKKSFDKELSVPSDKASNRRKSFDEESQDISEKLNSTFDKDTSNGNPKRKRKSDLTEYTAESKSLITNTSSDKAVKMTPNGILNTTFEKDDIDQALIHKNTRKSNITEQKNGLLSLSTSHSSESKERNKEKLTPRKSLRISEYAQLNGTFGTSPQPDQTKPKSLDTTFDKDTKLDTTFDKETKLDTTFDKENKMDTFEKIDSLKATSAKSSLISSDATISSLNVTLDKSDEVSRINITDDDSKSENILNATPLLVESSVENCSTLESSLKENKSPVLIPTTPLKREATFTKEGTEVGMSPTQTPSKRHTLHAAGCTPYHSNNKGPKKKSVLNLTHSIEKQEQRSLLAEVPPRAARVMFCSPINNPVVVTQQRSKVIKSNLKGSNKSFVYEESESSLRAGRKRSLSLAPSPAAAKRPRPAPPARARAASAGANVSTPAPRSELKASKLPNFAALHARRFQRMESLDECQRRRAERAQRLLQPTGRLDVLERSPRVTTPAKPSTPARPAAAAALPTLASLQHGYTRFGFKMDCGVNPFSASKPLAKPKETRPKPAEKKSQPSLAGATSLRKAAAKQAIMREKSLTGAGRRDEVRQESRTIIKGVRTNRRFELQMKSRNIN